MATVDQPIRFTTPLSWPISATANARAEPTTPARISPRWVAASAAGLTSPPAPAVPLAGGACGADGAPASVGRDGNPYGVYPWFVPISVPGPQHSPPTTYARPLITPAAG